MFNFFKRDDEEEKQISFVRGLSYGLGGTLIILIIALLVIFGSKLVKSDNNSDDGVPDGNSAEASKLRITVVTSKSCEGSCFDINLFLDALRQNNIEELGLETLYIEDNQGKELADRYAITKVPTVLIAGELNKDPQLAGAWAALGEIIDDVFVFRQLIPPYIEVETGNVRGEFDLTYLTDQSCEDCYDVNLHDTALINLGLNPKSSTVADIDSDEGQALVDRYSITKVPTIVMTGDLSEYQGLQQIWSIVGEISDEGAYVFTGLEEMGTYKDLESGEVVEVELPAPGAPVVQ
jgi:hypothetical protein